MSLDPPLHRPPSILFHGAKLQRALLILAKHGPLRIKPLQIALKTKSIRDIKTLERAGLTTLWGLKGRGRLIGINETFPAYIELRALLLRLGEIYGVKELEIPTSRQKRTFDLGDQPERPQDELFFDELFGSPFRTRALIGIQQLHGCATVADIRAILHSKTPNALRAINYWLDQKIIVKNRNMVELNSHWPAFVELQAFLEAFVSLRPEFKPSLKPSRKKKSATGKLDWNQPIEGEVVPGGMRPAADGTPLLFGTNARFRILTLLAINGPLRSQQVIRGAEIAASGSSLRDFIKSNIIVDLIAGEKKDPQLIDINPKIPGYEELKRLLIRLDERFPVKRLLLETRGKQLPVIRQDYQWKGRIDRIFGGGSRSETFLMLAAMGPAKTAVLGRAIKNHDKGEITRGLEMWRHYGILRGGGTKPWELDPDWFGAKELKAFLDVLLDADGRFRARISGISLLKGGKRKK